MFIDDNAIPCEKKSKLRLFRTPSLPYRLKFRCHPVSELTPAKKNTKQQASSELTTPASASTVPNLTPIAPPPVISKFRKSERNLLEKKTRDEKYIEKLQADVEDLNEKIVHLNYQNTQKSSEIIDLNKNIDNMKIAEEFLESIAKKAIKKISQSDEKVKEILHNYDILLHHMDRMTRENEKLLDLNDGLTKSNGEFTKINEERIFEIEKTMKLKNDEFVKMKHKLIERNKLLKILEFDLEKMTTENQNLRSNFEKSEEYFKIFEVQHEENLKMVKNSYENEIFFLYSQLSKTQNQLLKLTKSRKKFEFMDLDSQIDFENQKTKLDIEKKNYCITIKNYQGIIEVLSLRLKNSDTDVENIMMENIELKSEISSLKTNYEKLRNSAEDLKKKFDEQNHLFEQLMISSETEMVSTISKINDYFNEKFFEIAELKECFDYRDKELKKISSSLLKEYTNEIEMARFDSGDKQKIIVDLEDEIKAIKQENIQLKMKLSEGNKTATLSTIEEATSRDAEEKNIEKRGADNLQLKLKVNGIT